MKKIISILLLAFFLTGCTKNMVTGRKQLNLVSETELQMLAESEYKNFLTINQVIGATASKDADMVHRAGSRIAAAIKNYYSSKGLTAVLEGYKWEFNLVNDKEANAWCMPGGKVVVYSGLLPLTQNEAGLSIVLGHEIAHAIAQHGSERMSQGLLQQMGGTALQIAIANKPAETQTMFLNAYGIGTSLGATLPFSRKAETEADKYGLYFVAMAGYNPREAIPFWERMAAAGGSKPPAFLSSHPSDAARIAGIKANMNEALKYYKPMRK
jgi:predicted Zn-dependent protease